MNINRHRLRVLIQMAMALALTTGAAASDAPSPAGERLQWLLSSHDVRYAIRVPPPAPECGERSR